MGKNIKITIEGEVTETVDLGGGNHNLKITAGGVELWMPKDKFEAMGKACSITYEEPKEIPDLTVVENDATDTPEDKPKRGRKPKT